MKKLFTYIILVFLIVSFSSAGPSAMSAFQQQNTTVQQQDTTQASGSEDKKDGFFKQIWSSIKGLFQKKKVKPVKPNPNIELRSVHANELRTYAKYGARPEAFWDSLWKLSYTPYISGAGRSKTTEIFGWHPYWMGSAYTSYNFNLLSSVSYFSYELNPDTGAPLTLNGWRSTKLVDMAKAHHCKVFLVVTNFGEKANHRFLTHSKAQKNSLDNIIREVKYRNADGVTLNFDLIPKKLRGEYNSYIIQLSNRLRTEKLQLNLAIPPVDVHLIYDFNVLASYVDRFVVMGYGYYGDGSKIAGPEAPLEKGNLWGNSTLQESVETYIADGIPPEKMILSVPYVAGSWKTRKATVPSRCLAYYGEIPYRTIKSEYSIAPVLEKQSSSLYYLFPDFSDGSVNQIWLDDTLSLARKYDLILSNKLKGVGIWALGYDNGYTELWQLLHSKFGAKTPSAGKDSTGIQIPADTPVSTVNISQDSLLQLQKKWEDSILAAVGSVVGKSPTGVADLPENDSLALRLKKEVFGWHPYWSKDKYKRYRYDLLTAISYFSYELDPETGSYTTLHDWKTTPMVDMARKNNCRIYLTVTNLGEINNRAFLSDFTAQKNSLSAIVEAAKMRYADGVTLNFEVVPGDLRDNLSLYVVGLSNALKAEGMELNMTVPAIDLRNAYAVEDLLNHVDQFILMGYNYYTRGSTVAGPEAPLRSGEIWKGGSLETSVATYLGKIPKEQLILALPYYGSVWDAPYAIIPTINSDFVKHITYADVRKKYINPPVYDTISYTAYYMESRGGDAGYTQTWFDNERTLAKKYDLVLDNDLYGVGIWALGYDDGYNDLWKVLEEKFMSSEADQGEGGEATADTFFAKLKRLLNLIKASQNAIIFLLSVILLVFLIGLLLAMTNARVVESLMTNKAFQIAFISIFLASLIAIFRVEDYIDDSELVFLLGGAMGAISIYLLQSMIIKKMNQKP